MRERRGVLINGSCRYPTPFGSRIVLPAERERRVSSIHLQTSDRAAHDDVVIAPCVVCAAAGRGFEGAPEIGEREAGGVGFDAEFDGRVIESVHRLAELLKQSRLRGELRVVRVEAAKRAKEKLAFESKRRASGKDFGDLFELIAN